MADRVAEFVIRFGGDASDLKALFADVKSTVTQNVLDMQRATDRLELFKSIQDNIPAIQRALDSAKAKVTEYSDAIAKAQAAGEKAPKNLVDGLAQAEKAAAAATRELARQQQQLTTLDTQLKAAGVDTTKLASEQTRLAEASRAAAEAAAVQQAKQVLGVTTLKDTQTEAARLKAAFETLKASGTLSATEIAAAQSRLSAELKTLHDSVTKVGGGVKTLGADVKAAFTQIGGPVLAAVGGVTAVTAAIHSAIDAAREYRQVFAEATAGTDLTTASAKRLADQARELAAEVGVNVNDSVRSLFALLKAGVPEANAIDVLRIAADAAQASLSDVGSGVRIAKLFLQDLKIPADQLGHAFDVLKVTVGGSREGFESFANSAGPLLNVAKASNIALDDLLATLRALTKAGLDDATAISDLQKIILSLATPEARQQLANYGITATDLQGIFTQLAGSGANLQTVLDLTGVSRKTAAAVAALINDQKRLEESFGRVATAGGAVRRVNEKLYDTPREIAERFHATLDITRQKLGELAGAGGRATQATTFLLTQFNRGLEIQGQFAAHQDAINVAVDQAILKWLGFGRAQEQAATAAEEVAQKEAAAAKATEDHTAAIETQRQELGTISAGLLKQAQALEQVVSEQVKAIEDGTKRQIDAIELAAGARRRQTDEERKAAEAARVAAGVIIQTIDGEVTAYQKVSEAQQQAGITAKAAAEATIAVQQDAAARELAILNDKVARIRAAEDAAFAARVKAAGSSAIELQKAADDEIAARTKSTQTILGLYEKLYGDLVKQAKASQDKVNALDAERISFSEQTALKIRAIKQQDISSDQAYAQTVRDIAEATSKAKRALDEGDYKVGKEYTDRAIQLAESLAKVEDNEGRVVVSALEAQQQKIRAITTARDQYVTALKAGADTAAKAAEKDNIALGTVEIKINELTKQLDEFRKKLAENIDKKIAISLDGVTQAQDIIKELTKPATKVITIETRRPGEQQQTPSGPTQAPEEFPVPFARGGPVGRPATPAAQPVAPLWRRYVDDVRTFADGGHVFRRPTYAKVPGVGDTDSVPALLEEGAFVVRKAASRHYGDAVMAQIADVHLASGGFVSGLQFGNPKIDKIQQYVQSLPPAEQERLKYEISLGGTNALIAKEEIAEGAATQERGAAKPIAPDDVDSPTATDAINYGRYVMQYLKDGGVFALVKRQIGTYINQVERDPTNASLIQGLIRSARAAASNLYLDSFNVGTGFGAQIPGKAPQLLDWYEFIKQGTKSILFQGGVRSTPVQTRRAEGGPITPIVVPQTRFLPSPTPPIPGRDSVRAMVMPGEYIMPARRVAQLGVPFMDALNRGAIPKLALERMFAPPQMRFAEGGLVPGAAIPRTGALAPTSDAALAGELHFHFHGATNDFTDPRVQRRAAAGIREQMRREGILK